MNKVEESGVGFTRHKAFVELLAESEKETRNGSGEAMDAHAPFAAGDLEWVPVYSNPWFSVSRKGRWHKVHRTTDRPGAATFAIDGLGRVLLVEIYRPSVDRVMLEIPMGLADAGETPADCAAREIGEETSLEVSAHDLEFLGYFIPDSGVLGYEIPIYLAALDHPFENLAPDRDEVLGCRAVPLEEVKDLIAAGIIRDGFTVFALHRYLAKNQTAMTTGNGSLTKAIEILDAQGKVRAEIETDRPDWSFGQYCRNRDTPGWSWRFRKRSGAG